MGYNYRKERRIALSILLFFTLAACENKDKATDKMVCEEIVLCSTLYGRCYINLIAHNQSTYKRVVCFPEFVNSINEVKDCFYTNEEFRKTKIAFRKDTLSAFFMQVRLLRIDLNSKVGTVFHGRYEEDASEEEKIENACTVLESQIFDTVFNDILHVKQCFHYSFIIKDEGWRFDLKYHLYYDVDRYIFVQIESWNLETNELIDIYKVDKINETDISCFEKNWDDTHETHTLFMPEIRF
jgi:hypothetical protein